MSVEYFNSYGGYSAGIPPVPVIDGNGNVVSNFNNLSGNVSANKVYANAFFYANGQPFQANPGGSNTQLQFNNNGALAGIPNVTFNGSNLSLGNVSNVKIGGGVNGYVLQTDGAGNLSWAASGGGGGNGSPGGSNSQIQYNSSGTFAGSGGFTYNDVSNTVSLVNLTANGNVNLGSVSNLTITGGTSGYFLRTDGLGNLSWAVGGGGGNGTPGGSNTYVQFNDDETFGGVSTFTFDKDTGILSIPILSATTNIIAGGMQTTGNITSGNLKVTGLANLVGNVRASGNVNFTGAANVTLGSVSNLHISGGSDGYVLQTDGLGNLSWSASGGGGNGSPGGSNTQVQFNDNGNFGGSPFFTYNNYTHEVQVGGNLIANSFQMGSGVYEWSTSQVYFATTASTALQSLYSVPVANISGAEFQIIATNATVGKRQSTKISSVVYQGNVQFTEYAGLYINGGVGTFQVDYDAGDIITPPSLQLKVTPDVSSQTVYKMLITLFAG